jgi:hypothetical protein
LWKLYVHGKQTYKQIGKRFGRSARWVKEQMEDVEVSIPIIEPGNVVVIMDTTYFRRTFGAMVFRCPHRKKNLLWKFLPHETNDEYVSGIEELQSQGWNVQAIVCDGRSGLFKRFSVPVQMCQYHQVAIVTRYITKRPRLEAGKDLKELMHLLTQTDEASFTHWLDEWHNKWKDFIGEKTVDEVTGRWRYAHRRVRSAYYSVRRNLPYLFTHERHSELNIPNTTNSLDGSFAHIKDLVRLHRGLKLHRKQRLISELLKGD